MLKGYAYFLPLRYCISELVDTAWVMNIQWVNWSISFCYNYFMDINNLSHKKILKGQDMEFSVFTRFFLNDQYQCIFKSMRKLSILWTICNKETLYKKKKKKEMTPVPMSCIDTHVNTLQLWTLIIASAAGLLVGW